MISERAKLVSWAYLVTDLTATTAAFVGAHAIRSWSLADWVGPVYPLSDYAPLLMAFVLPVWALVFYVSGPTADAPRAPHRDVAAVPRPDGVRVVAGGRGGVRLAFVSRPLLGLFRLLNAVGVVVGRGFVQAVILDSDPPRVLVAGGLEEVRAAAAASDPRRLGPRAAGVVSDGMVGRGSVGLTGAWRVSAPTRTSRPDGATTT